MIVSKTSGGLKWPAWAKRDGDWERLLATIDGLQSLPEAHAYRAILTNELRSLPPAWDEPLWDRFNERLAELKNEEMDEQWRARL